MPDASIVFDTESPGNKYRGESLLPTFTALSKKNKKNTDGCATVSDRGYVCTLGVKHPLWCPHIAGSAAGVVEIWYDEAAMAKMNRELEGVSIYARA